MLRFQADANLNQIIVRAVCRREPSVDFQTAKAAGLSGVADPEVLARAAEEGRVLVTHDFQTMAEPLCGVHCDSTKCRALTDSTVSSHRFCSRRLTPDLVNDGG
jgi:hypothetical protein